MSSAAYTLANTCAVTTVATTMAAAICSSSLAPLIASYTAAVIRPASFGPHPVQPTVPAANLGSDPGSVMQTASIPAAPAVQPPTVDLRVLLGDTWSDKKDPMHTLAQALCVMSDNFGVQMASLSSQISGTSSQIHAVQRGQE